MQKLLLAYLLFFQHFKCPEANDDKRLSKVNVVYKLPFLMTADSIDIISDSTFIYYLSKFIVYEVPERNLSFINNELISDSLKSIFFAYDTGKRFGYHVKSLNDSIHKRGDVDSFLKDRPHGDSFEKVLDISVFQREMRPSSGKIIKAYKVNDIAVDSAFFYYDKSFKGIPFSLSKKLDSLYNSKLYKVEFVLKKDISKNAVAFNRFRKISWTLNESQAIDNEHQIMDFIHRLEEKYDRDFR